MNSECVLKEIEAATKLNSESKRTTNDALSHAAGVIRSLEKELKAYETDEKDYKRGCKDAWDLACDICCSTAFGGLTNEQLEMVFGKDTTMGVMDNYSYERAKELMDRYEEKKKKKEGSLDDPIIQGDVVIYTRLHTNYCNQLEGIFCGIDADSYYIILKDNYCTQILPICEYTLSKTGKHVDLNW